MLVSGGRVVACFAVLVLVLIASSQWLRDSWPRRLAVSVPFATRTPSGELLGSLFDGSKVSPLYSVEHVQKVNLQNPGCGVAAPGKQSKSFWRFFEETIVQAQTQCLSETCSGSYWVDDYAFCDTGIYCFGSYRFARYDPQNGNQCSGSCRNGGHCGLDDVCGCSVKPCQSCGTPEYCYF